jgi:hypothetical protein
MLEGMNSRGLIEIAKVLGQVDIAPGLKLFTREYFKKGRIIFLDDSHPAQVMREAPESPPKHRYCVPAGYCFLSLAVNLLIIMACMWIEARNEPPLMEFEALLTQIQDKKLLEEINRLVRQPNEW